MASLALEINDSLKNQILMTATAYRAFKKDNNKEMLKVCEGLMKDYGSQIGVMLYFAQQEYVDSLGNVHTQMDNFIDLMEAHSLATPVK